MFDNVGPKLKKVASAMCVLEKKGLFDNAGSKLKKIASVMCVVECALCVILGLVMWMNNSRYNPTILTGFIVMGLGSLVSWIQAVALYAFGELVESSQRSAQKLEEISAFMIGKNGDANAKAPIAHSDDEGRKNTLLKAAVVGGWTCPMCGNHNRGTEEYCFVCMEKRP